jgi:hypothetical protein
MVLVRERSLQPHRDPDRAAVQFRGERGHDHGEPAVGTGDRLPRALHQQLATVTADRLPGPGGRSGQGRADAPPDAELTVSDRSSI